MGAAGFRSVQGLVGDARPAGSVLALSDLASAEIDLAEEPSQPLTDGATVVGRPLARAVKPGQ